ncbi:MAG: TM0106 family RecB-like putative nuclease, partial [Alphaproteobacteria bacterium]|nr:TM0106 family RecB-like putative nuclease [Alphaproteobacteria bacterium]
MHRDQGALTYTATDLVGFLACRRLTELDRAVAEGRRAKPHIWDDPLAKVLIERGEAHERDFVAHLKQRGLDAVRIGGVEVTPAAVEATREAMRKGVPVIVQAAFARDGWRGRADVLQRRELPSALGPWSYEAIDTKLARETKAGAILQLCLYSDLLADAQGLAPEHFYVVVPLTDFVPERYRFADYAAYYRKVKTAFAAFPAPGADAAYPDPVEHCEICKWGEACDKVRRDDDHLSLVAGISKLQIAELKARGITTLAGLDAMPSLTWRPERGSAKSYDRVRNQARIVA